MRPRIRFGARRAITAGARLPSNIDNLAFTITAAAGFPDRDRNQPVLAPGPHGVAPGAPAVDRAETGFVLLFAAFAAVSWVGVSLLSAGRFRPGLVASGSLFACILAVGLARASLRRDVHAVQSPPRRHVMSAVFAAMVAGLLFFQPAEYVFDGADGSVYLAIAKIIQKHGSVTPVDPLLAAIPPDDRGLLFSESPAPALYNRFPGGIQIGAGGDELRPNFFHGYPAWLAIVESTFGPFSGIYLNAVLGVCSVLVLWLLARRLSSPLAAMVAALLLALNFAQVWFARFPSTEILSQFLLLSGLYLSVLAIDTKWAAAGAGAGAAFGLAGFVRIDSLLIGPPVVAVLIAASIKARGQSSTWRWFAGVFAALLVQSCSYALFWSGPYTMRTLEMLRRHAVKNPWNILLLAVFALAAVALGIVVHRAKSIPRWTRVLAACGVALLLGFALSKEMMDGFFMRLLSRPVLVLAVAGLVMLVWTRRFRAAPVALVFASGAIYLISALDFAMMPWVLRRYVPILLPLAALGLAHLTHIGRLRFGPAALVLPVAVGVWFAWQTWPILRTPVMNGAIAQAQQIADLTPPEALLLWQPSAASHLPLALNYAFDRESLLIPDGEGRAEALQRLALRMLASGRPVRLIVDDAQGATSGSLRRDELSGLDLQLRATATVQFDSAPVSRRELPRGVNRNVRHLDIYELLSRRETTTGLPMRMDIGGKDFPYLLEGFYAPEAIGADSIRWTNAVARVAVPAFTAPQRRDATLCLRVAAHRPNGTKAGVEVEWNGRVVGRLDPEGSFTEHCLPLPETTSASPSSVVTLRSNAFVPGDNAMGADGRTLGVMVDWIELR